LTFSVDLLKSALFNSQYQTTQKLIKAVLIRIFDKP